MSAKVKCCVPGCDLKNPTSTHGIPDEEKEPFSRNIWIQALKLNSVKLTTYSRVCSHHFEPSDILPSNRLKRGTNPTRNLPVGYSLFFRQSLFTFLENNVALISILLKFDEYFYINFKIFKNTIIILFRDLV